MRPLSFLTRQTRRSPQRRSWCLEQLEERSLLSGSSLVGTALDVQGESARWGDTVQVSYTIANQGTDPASAFSAHLVLLPDEDPTPSPNPAPQANLDVSLGTPLPGIITVNGLAANASASGSIAVTLPGSPDNPPAGYQEPQGVVVVLVIDSSDASSTNEFAPLTIYQDQETKPDNTTDTANVIGPTASISGSLQGPGDVAYYSLAIARPGYLTATVTPGAASILDSSLTLSNVPSALLYDNLRIGGGGVLASSDDQGPGNPNPLLNLYVLPGQYWLAVSSSRSDAAASGTYQIQTTFTADASNPYDPSSLLAQLGVGADPVSIITADFSRNGILDLATANHNAHTVSVLLGTGDASVRPNFEPAVQYPVPFAPSQVVAADVNNDGRLSLVVLDDTRTRAFVLLGIGDGTFTPASNQPIDLATHPALAALFARPQQISPGASYFATVTVTDSYLLRDLSVILDVTQGQGASLTATLVAPDGTRVPLFQGVGGSLSQVILEDQAAASIDAASGDLQGTFQPLSSLAALNGKNVLGTWTLELTNDSNATLQLNTWALLANDDFDYTNTPSTYAIGDFSRNGSLSEASLVSTGNGTFANYVKLATGLPANTAGAMVDLTQFQDLPGFELLLQLISQGAIPINSLPGGAATVLQAFLNLYNQNNGTLPDQVPIAQFFNNSFYEVDSQNPVNATPLAPIFADPNGDGVDDLVEVNQTGDILVRYGEPGKPGSFAAPLTINADRTHSPGAREVMVLSTGAHARLAALDLFSDSVTIYTRQDNGTWEPTGTLATGPMPNALAAGDLNGDGIPDLVVADALTGAVSIYPGQPDGSFGAPQSIEVGLTLSSVVLSDVTGAGLPDLLVTNPASGQVSVLLNQSTPGGAIAVADPQPYRAGNGPYGTVEFLSNQANAALGQISPALEYSFPSQFFLVSREQTGTVVSGDFNSDGIPDLVVLNPGTNTFSLLAGTGDGSFVDPQVFAAGDDPIAVAVGNLDGHLDLAILDRGSDSVEVFQGNGAGGFTLVATLDAGNVPTGLTVADFYGDGKLDLLIGNQFGDVLVLQNQGNDHFAPYQRTDQQVLLAVADLTGNGLPDFVYTDRSRDTLTVQYSQPGQAPFQQGRTNGLLGPGAVKLVDLNGDGIPDMVVANSQGNDVLVYLGLPGGGFAEPQSFFVGTNPVNITVADLTGDGESDLIVANQGSNDVSILFGKGTGANWTLTEGQRLDAGLGPTSTAVANVNGVPDLLVSDGTSNQVTVLPGVGNGFFNDQNPTTFQVGSDPKQVLVGHFTGPGLDVATVNAGSNDLTLFRDPNFASSDNLGLSIATGGTDPVAAVVGDFNGNGFDDLVIANHDDGVISVFFGSQTGLKLEDRALLAQASDLATVEDNEQVSIYGVGEGNNGAVPLFTFELVGPGPFNGGNGTVQPTTTVVALGNSRLDIVVILVPANSSVTAELLTRPGDPPTVGGVPLPNIQVDAGAAPTGPGTSDAAPARTGPPENGGVTDEASAGGGEAASRRGRDPHLLDYVSGVDDALRPSAPPNELPPDPEPSECEASSVSHEEAFSTAIATMDSREEASSNVPFVDSVNRAEDGTPAVQSVRIGQDVWGDPASGPMLAALAGVMLLQRCHAGARSRVPFRGGSPLRR